MSNFNFVERNAAKLLGRFPLVKRFAKSIYSRLVYLTAKKKISYQTLADPIVYTSGRLSSFFGYYDKSPDSGSGQVLGVLCSHSTAKPPSSRKMVEIAVFGHNREVSFRVPVSAYNWQQGSRAHWLSDDLFIFNDFDGEKSSYVSSVYSASTGQRVKLFDRPVQDSFGTEYFVSLNYRRLMALRPDYGYRNLPALSGDQLAELESDGIWRVQYDSGESKLLISLADACAVKPVPEFAKATHKFNHVMISPDGRRFIFMHRYMLGQRRFDRLLLADAESGKVRLLCNYGMVSHCSWADENTVLGYMRGPNGVDGYWLLDVESGQLTPLLQDRLGLYGDGHPHVRGDWFITDTYPNRSRMQHLLLCNWKTGEIKEVGEFFHGFEYSGESRCDLHPRFSRDGKSVFFDSVFAGQRQLYRLDLPQ